MSFKLPGDSRVLLVRVELAADSSGCTAYYYCFHVLRAEEYYNFIVDQGSRNLKDASSAAALHGPVSHETLTRSAAMVVSRSGDGGPVSSPDSCPKAS